MEPCVNPRRERAFQLSRPLSPQRKKDERPINCLGIRDSGSLRNLEIQHEQCEGNGVHTVRDGAQPVMCVCTLQKQVERSHRQLSSADSTVVRISDQAMARKALSQICRETDSGTMDQDTAHETRRIPTLSLWVPALRFEHPPLPSRWSPWQSSNWTGSGMGCPGPAAQAREPLPQPCWHILPSNNLT